MSQWSGIWTTTSGSTTGDRQASYTQSDDAILKRVTAACWGYQGIAPNYLNELKATYTALNTVQVATGAAMVDGKVFLNNAAVDVTIPSAGGGNHVRYRIVVRADWDNYDVAITAIANDPLDDVLPSISQVSGDLYDIQICQVRVDDGGVCVVTDERDFAQPPEIGLAVLGTVMATTPVTWGAIGATSYNKVLTVDPTSGVNWAVITDVHITDGAIGVAHLGTMVPGLLGRQGGNASDWTIYGTGGYSSGINVRMQCGVDRVAVSNAYQGSLNVTFPTAFSDKPLVFAQVQSGPGAVQQWAVTSAVATASGVALGFAQMNQDLSTGYVTIHWLAIGPE